MASLIETLIDVLEKENDEYEKLLELSIEKTGIIVKNNVDALNEMVAKEQQIVERINAIEKKRADATNDIAMVLNKKPEILTLEYLTQLLAGQKKECDALKSVHDKLKNTLSNMVRVNDNNKELLQESIDMVQFEINLMHSLKQAPATANYSGTSYVDDGYGAMGSFDAKQ